MDLAEIQRQVKAAREFTQNSCGATFTLRLPTRLDSRVALARVMTANPGESDNDVLAIQIERQTLLQSVVGWSGVMVSWVLPNGESPDEPYEFQAAAVPLLLDARPDVADELSRALFERLRAFNDARDTAAKN